MDSQEFREATNAMLDECISSLLALMVRQDGWEDLGVDDGVRKSQMLTDAGIQMARAIGEINHSAEEICTFLLDHKRRKSYQKTSLEVSPVQTYSDKFQILYELYDMPWPVSNRDFVRAIKVVDREDGLLFVGKSIDGVVPEKDGVVRAEIIASGYYLRRIRPNTTEVTYLIAADPKGLIPNIIVNSLAEKECSTLSKIRKVLG